MKKMALTKGIVFCLLLSFPMIAGASDQGHVAPKHDAPAEHVVDDGHDAMKEEHVVPAHGEEAAGDHGGGHHGPILSGVTDPIGTGFLTYIIIMTLFIIPMAVHNENKKHAHGHGGGGHDDAHSDGHEDAHNGDNGHGDPPHGSH